MENPNLVVGSAVYLGDGDFTKTKEIGYRANTNPFLFTLNILVVYPQQNKLTKKDIINSFDNCSVRSIDVNCTNFHYISDVSYHAVFLIGFNKKYLEQVNNGLYNVIKASCANYNTAFIEI